MLSVLGWSKLSLAHYYQGVMILAKDIKARARRPDEIKRRGVKIHARTTAH